MSTAIMNLGKNYELTECTDPHPSYAEHDAVHESHCNYVNFAIGVGILRW